MKKTLERFTPLEKANRFRSGQISPSRNLSNGIRKNSLTGFDLNFKSKSILGLGAEGKSRICLARGKRAYLSDEIGDLKKPVNFSRFKFFLSSLPQKLHIQPEIVVYDLHPLYLSTRLAKKFKKARLVGVQHHWAHIGSVLIEKGITSPVIGLAFDGTGFGLDGNLWGGEILLADLKKMERVGHFKNILLPGGGGGYQESLSPGIQLFI